MSRKKKGVGLFVQTEEHLANKTKQILILPGDGIGQEVTSSMVEVLQYLISEQSLDFKISERKVFFEKVVENENF